MQRSWWAGRPRRHVSGNGKGAFGLRETPLGRGRFDDSAGESVAGCRHRAEIVSKGCRLPGTQSSSASLRAAVGRSRYRAKPLRVAIENGRRRRFVRGCAVGLDGIPRRQMTYHRILRLPPHEADPVQIISAAYVQLRRWRTGEQAVSASERQRRVRLIIVARDAMLRHVLDDRSAMRQSRSVLRRVAHARSVGAGIALSERSSVQQSTTLDQGFTEGVE